MSLSVPYAVNASSMPHSSVWDDMENAVATGTRGLGLWERKLIGVSDAEVALRMREAGLAATFCVPTVNCILPSQIDPPGVPQDILDRRDLICASIERLAAFDPAVVTIAPGASGDPDNPAGPLEAVLEVLPAIADAAASCGVRIGLELLARRRGSAVPSMRELVDILDAVGRDNVGIMFSVFHSWSDPGLHEDLRRYASRINSVQVCDIRDPERCAFDRELPGRGRGVAPEIMATLIEAGYRGWWELEIFSDDGTYGTVLPDSYWAMPPERFLHQAREAFDGAHAAALEILAIREGRWTP
jgi:sugar phosphate isomerase/epimerase